MSIPMTDIGSNALSSLIIVVLYMLTLHLGIYEIQEAHERPEVRKMKTDPLQEWQTNFDIADLA